MRITSICLLILIGCISCYHNPVERNTIVLKDDVLSVEKAMSQMTDLMAILPERRDANKNYIVKANDSIFVNEEPVGTIKRLESNDVISVFSERQKRDFVRLAAYLKRNHMASCYLEFGTKRYLFPYRKLEDYGYNDFRDLMLVTENRDENPATILFQVLDRRSNIVLLAPADAEIR
ncbi:hypothetical protein HUK80_05165 [Flavobacterium sp. MAH-1]|uniref:Uncharacterized protein n=1 Tax=Flavobacterium agri TaxID=2743471 RepID=A0A7Y8Y1U0_9FLAO|nr:hypothetical protein [Flavobacterium agri]NUY80278.1 hypothetical protein [Flavobacterium agri]NYA70303.1 hypothetical protein [Flavobacterium agri]